MQTFVAVTAPRVLRNLARKQPLTKPRKQRFGQTNSVMPSDSGSEESSSSEENYDLDWRPKPVKLGPEAKTFKSKVSTLLEKVAKMGSGEFATSGELPGPPVIVIDIEGVGKMTFPMYDEQAKAFASKFEQSPYGKKEETIIDTSVRNSKQLSPESFKILHPGWEAYLKSTAIKKIAEEFCIKTDFHASLYKLLLYEPGAFFKPHRDTEKEPGMFGTLVIQLPSNYSGGELKVKHGKLKKRFDFSSSGNESDRAFKMFFSAFYCDCRHEILPMTEGYRVCLVYNLISTSKKDSCPQAPDAGKALQIFEEEFTNTVLNWPQPELHKLVYVLSHKYTEFGLGFQSLKGTDRGVASLFKQYADKCSLRYFLVLLTMTECYGGFEGKYEDYHIEKFISENKSLNSGKMNVFRVECIPSDCFKDDVPVKVDYECCGNEGATMDKWYNKSAIVFWPESQMEVVVNDCEDETLKDALKDEMPPSKLDAAAKKRKVK